MIATVLTLLAQAQPAPPPLSLEHRALLRCSAAFALVSADNGAGPNAGFGNKAREFFVRASVRIMDDTGRSREQVALALRKEAGELVRSETLDAALPPCLAMLETSGL